jgi:carotenoid cleavage dioxygenase-like enzyme
MSGPYAPMRFEATIEHCLVVEGEVPKELNGGFYRAGPSWRRPTQQGCDTLFTEDGMVQGLTFREGRVDFRNRWVRTEKFLKEDELGEGIFRWEDGDFGDWRAWGRGQVERDERNRGIPQGTHTVNALPFGGQVLAMGELVVPYALDPITLDTIGPVPWSDKLGPGLVEPAGLSDGAFAAHPKWDPETGELYGWSAMDTPPYVTLHWVKPDGTVRTRELWDAPYSQWAHDMWLTKSYVVIPFQPFVVDTARIGQGMSVNGWDTEKPLVFALIPRDDMGGEIRWIEADIEPQYVMHMLSANETDGKLILDAPIFNRPPFMTDDLFTQGKHEVPYLKIASSQFGRWVIDLESGRVTSEIVDDAPCELPKVDERFYGKGYEWGFLAAGDPRAKDGMRLNKLVRRNVRTGFEESYTLHSEGRVSVFEETFAPRGKDAPEGDGYVIVPLCKFGENRSEFQIFDTRGITEGPIARIELPFQIGFTPHGHWMNFE